MEEFKYLDQVTTYRNQLIDKAIESVKSIIDFYNNDKNETTAVVPPVITSSLIMKKESLFAQYDEKDRASWDLKTMTQTYGAWFEQSPLEIVPPFPNNKPSKAFIESLKGFERWGIHERKINHEAIFKRIFDEKLYYQCDKEDRLHRQWIGLFLLSLDINPWERDTLFNQSHTIHNNAGVRAMVLSLAFFDLPWVPAERYLYDCTHDTDETVFIKAFRICARIHDERAMDHLRPIVKSPSAVLESLMSNKMYYPVGHAACNICPAQFAIISTDIPELAKIREKELLKRNRKPLSEPVEHAREDLLNAIKNYSPPPRSNQKPNLDGMVKIPEGAFYYGMHEKDIQNEVFDWSTCTPQKEMNLKEFYIDKYPVTNAAYDQWEKVFSALPEDKRCTFEHPGQKAGKTHRRNTFDDPRFGPDHPVVGIDWFDAWAYARFHHKELPDEYQWEKAAKGNTSWRYPWGDHFDNEALRCANETYGITPNNIVEWVILLNKGTRQFPATTTSPVHAHPKGASPYGVHDMCGNCWEFTKTSFYTKADARLPFADFTPIELMGSREGHVVIRGGAWSSPAPLIGSSYRGYDLLTDRHTEIGFRCVYNL